jgi:hypothetical protein
MDKQHQERGEGGQKTGRRRDADETPATGCQNRQSANMHAARGHSKTQAPLPLVVVNASTQEQQAVCATVMMDGPKRVPEGSKRAARPRRRLTTRASNRPEHAAALALFCKASIQARIPAQPHATCRHAISASRRTHPTVGLRRARAHSTSLARAWA